MKSVEYEMLISNTNLPVETTKSTVDSKLQTILIFIIGRQIPVDIKMKIYQIKTNFVGPEMPKAGAKVLVLIFLLFYFLFVENWI